MKRKTVSIALLTLTLAVVLILPSAAQSTTKQLSTNFTLVNLSASGAQGNIRYVKPDGSAWRADESFTLPANGGQAIYRQYLDASLSSGQGSVIIESNEPVGAVAQILARGQNPTSSGAYSGIPDGDTSFYVPLAARKLTTASGLGNSQLVVQNTTAAPATVEIQLINSSGATTYTKSGINIAANASYEYDLAEEASSNVPDSWVGSAVVRATNVDGKVAVVSNFFTGDALQTFNAFPSSVPGVQWFVPQFNSRMANSLSTPISVQNLSGGSIPIDGVQVVCSPTSGGSPITLKNTTAIANSASYAFNPVVDTSIPAGFEGSCIVDASANVVAFVQMRFVTAGEAAAYEAFRPSTDKKLIVPLVAKRLPNGFATAVTIQNLNTTTVANVKLTYTPSATDCAGCATITIDKTIQPGANLIQNHGILAGGNAVTEMPAGWNGTLVVTSDQPVAGFVQLRFRRDVNPGLPGGDLFMAHDAFTQP
jgi:hypothetical protein